MEDGCSNIFEAFLASSNNHPLNTAIYYKKDDHYTTINYHELKNQTINLAFFLSKNNIKKGDCVAIIMENDPSWIIAFFSLMKLGATVAPLNHQLESEEIEAFLKHCQAQFIITSLNSYTRLKKIASLLNITIFPLDFEEVIKKIDISSNSLPSIEIETDSLASIVYTSGTTSTPKGVMLTHKNFLANISSLKKLHLINEKDCLIALLPFYHTYSFMVTMLLPLLTGAKISFPLYYDIQEIMDCMEKTKTTILVGIPRFFELLHRRISKNINQLFLLKRLLLKLLLNLSFPLRKYIKLNISKLIMGELHKRLGRYLRFMVSGGAKLNEKIAWDFYKWGFTILEGYGLTETSPVVSFNTPQSNKIGSVGKTISGVEVKIINSDENKEGEILIKGNNVTKGYYKEEKYTKEVIKDGWLYTGDIGYLDKDGFLYIKGRKKELIVLSSGKKINPDDLEAHYLKSPYIEEICIFLSQDNLSKEKEILTAAILPNYHHFRTHHIQQVKDKIRFEIENISRSLPSYKRIKKYVIIGEKLPRTPLGKIKRYEVNQKYSLVYTPEKTPHLIPQDKYLLNSPLCQKALEYLKKELNHPVNLDDHLELDLGLDSLEQIELLLGFQKVTGIRINDEDALGIFTVRDALKKLHILSLEKKTTPTTPSTKWQEILSQYPHSITKLISIKQNLIIKSVNFIIGIFLNMIIRIFFLLEVKNKKNLPLNGPYIIAPNHTSYLDGFIIATALWPQIINNVYFLGYSGYFQHPLIAWTVKLFRFVSIDPILHLVESMQACAYILKNSKILCMFPEGVRSSDGKIKQFKKGIGILAKELKVPIVPVYIKGTFSAWPRYRLLPKPAKIKIIFGKKITPEELLLEKEETIDEYETIINNLRNKILDLTKYV